MTTPQDFRSYGRCAIGRSAVPVPLPASPTPRPEVLLVEDDLALLDVMERQLQRAGLFVRHATTGEQAIALARGRTTCTSRSPWS